MQPTQKAEIDDIEQIKAVLLSSLKEYEIGPLLTSKAILESIFLLDIYA